jgi:Raf kinase inhibitor-like YbhB/YbcL family protein
MKLFVVCVAIAAAVSVQNPPAAGQAGQQPGQRGAAPPAGGQRGGGRGRGAVQVMTLSTTGWPDGGMIPAKYSQEGVEVSPPLAWSGVPDTAKSFVLIAHDIDAASGTGADDVLQWMLWNIPGESRSLPEHIAQGPELADGTRQISVTGPYYRGPAAPNTGPVHHYVFELYALDATIDVQPSADAFETRANVMKAIQGHILAKAVYGGLFKRPQ